MCEKQRALSCGEGVPAIVGVLPGFGVEGRVAVAGEGLHDLGIIAAGRCPAPGCQWRARRRARCHAPAAPARRWDNRPGR